MIGILIIAHGNLGESLIDCAIHVMGNCPPLLKQLPIQHSDDPSYMLNKAQAMLAELDQGHGVLVLSDMYGATPCNIVAKLTKNKNVMGVAGVNLPMLVRALTYRNGDLQKLVEKAMSGGREGVVQFDSETLKHTN